MTPDLKGISRYLVVGICNTVIHWTVFFALCLGWHAPQSLANLAGFGAAASFSFYANAIYTFSARLSWSGYLLFMSFMGAMSFIAGHISDGQETPLLVTLVVSSGLSLSLGYCCSRYLIFRRPS
ncbi:GtrA family protein [Pseudomonas folii]|uniref:Bactoprenol-linked glucose translocase n=1 Tax=Pseudomonas folii TaxID=2762593 RepID=A0ABR7AYF6_9PSED|nr:GtrA family protein [Pseudomonas folii]MBC3949966.1 GtrA family protein [Pseudomonas folii]